MLAADVSMVERVVDGRASCRWSNGLSMQAPALLTVRGRASRPRRRTRAGPIAALDDDRDTRASCRWSSELSMVERVVDGRTGCRCRPPRSLPSAGEHRGPGGVLAQDPSQRSTAIAILERVVDVPHVRLEAGALKQAPGATPVEGLCDEPDPGRRRGCASAREQRGRVVRILGRRRRDSLDDDLVVGNSLSPDLVGDRVRLRAPSAMGHAAARDHEGRATGMKELRCGARAFRERWRQLIARTEWRAEHHDRIERSKRLSNDERRFELTKNPIDHAPRMYRIGDHRSTCART